MPIIKVYGKQLLHFFTVFVDAFLPLWRILRIPERFHAKFINVFLIVIILFVLLPWINCLSPFPSGDTQFYDANGKLTTMSHGTNISKIEIKLFCCFLLILIVIAAFLIDLKDAMSGKSLDRFIYHDDTHSYDKQVWWMLAVLLVGYMLRIWLFGLIVIIGIEGAHISSVLKTGFSVVNESSPLANISGLTNKIFLSLQNPIGPWGEEKGGSLDSNVFILISNTARLIIFMFLVSAFYLLISKTTQNNKEEDNI